MDKSSKPTTLVLPAFADGISTLQIIEGLQGVCTVLDESAAYSNQLDLTHQLGMAAKVLSTMLFARLPQ